MKRVCLMIPPVEDQYPYAAVRCGMAVLGWVDVPMGERLEADVLITWSPWNGSLRQKVARSFSDAGKPVIVMENGWLSPIMRRKFYQVALNGWNGTGTFPAGGPERWAGWNVPVMPWRRENGSYALVIGQTGSRSDPRTATPEWHKTLALPMSTLRRSKDCIAPLRAQLGAAKECHVWTSNAASEAILAGVPVVQHGPNLMVSELASKPGKPLVRPDRLPVLQRLAWAQWSATEVATGEPFKRLLVP